MKIDFIRLFLKYKPFMIIFFVGFKSVYSKFRHIKDLGYLCFVPLFRAAMFLIWESDWWPLFDTANTGIGWIKKLFQYQR